MDVLRARLETDLVLDPDQFENRQPEFAVNPRTLARDIRDRLEHQGHQLNPGYALATAISDADLEGGQKAWSQIHDIQNNIRNMERDLTFNPDRLMEFRKNPALAEHISMELLNQTSDPMTFQLLTSYDQNTRPGGNPDFGMRCLALAETRDQQVKHVRHDSLQYERIE